MGVFYVCVCLLCMLACVHVCACVCTRVSTCMCMRVCVCARRQLLTSRPQSWTSPIYWSEAVSSLPDRKMRFTYNDAVGTLPTNAGLVLWYEGQVSAQCKLCGFPTQTLKHVLKTLRQRRFDSRHDCVYYPLFTSSSSATLKSHVSLPGQAYCFPVHIAATDKRPDIVIGTGHQYMLVELTVPFKENFADAECRKRDFYTYLLWLCTCNGYKAHRILIQVGSRGVLDLPSLSSRCASPQ